MSTSCITFRSLPFTNFSFPEEPEVVDHIAAVYSSMSFIVLMLCVVLFSSVLLSLIVTALKKTHKSIYQHRIRFMIEVAMFVFLFFVCDKAKGIFKTFFENQAISNRPEGSCKTTTAMPSGHVTSAMAVFFFIFVRVCIFRVFRRSFLLTGTILVIASILLLPVGWSRVQLKDHTWQQVLGGVGFGALLGVPWACVHILYYITFNYICLKCINKPNVSRTASYKMSSYQVV